MDRTTKNQQDSTRDSPGGLNRKTLLWLTQCDIELNRSAVGKNELPLDSYGLSISSPPFPLDTSLPA